MKGWKRYAVCVLSGMFFAVYMMCVPVYAEETGIPAGLSEKVYAEMNVDGSVVGNIIKGETFSILAAELDASKNVWYLVKMSTGTVGYMQAASVTRIGAGEVRQENSSQEADGESKEDSGGQTQTSDEQAEHTDSQDEQTENNSEWLENEEIQIENDDIQTENSSEETEGVESTVQSVQSIRGVNIRKSTSTKADILVKAPPNAILECIGVVENQAGETWYEVIYKDTQGYVKKSAVREFQTTQLQIDADIVEAGQEETESEEASETALPDVFEDITVKDNEIASGAANDIEAEPEMGTADDMEFIFSEMPQEQHVLYVDWVLALSALGALVCTIVAFCLLRRVIRICRMRT